MQGVIHGCDMMMSRSREELLEVELVRPKTPDRIREVAGGRIRGEELLGYHLQAFIRTELQK